MLDSRGWTALPPIQTVQQRRVRVYGRWLPQHSRWLDNRTLDGRAGYVVVTPLRLEPAGHVLLVQRGWAPRDVSDRRHLPLPVTPDGVVELDGELEPLPGHRMELGHSSEPGPIRQNIDLDELSRACGQPIWALTLQQTSDSGDGLLRRWPQRDAGVATHYGYAAQWFALSLLIVTLYGWFQIRPAFRRQR